MASSTVRDVLFRKMVSDASLLIVRRLNHPTFIKRSTPVSNFEIASSQARACARRGCPCRRATTARAEPTNDRENKIGLPCRDRTCWCVRHRCRYRRNCRLLNGELLGHPGAQHSAGGFNDDYGRFLQSGRPRDLDHEKIGSGARHSFHRLRCPGAAIPCDDWHRFLDTSTMPGKVTALSGLP